MHLFVQRSSLPFLLLAPTVNTSGRRHLGGSRSRLKNRGARKNARQVHNAATIAKVFEHHIVSRYRV
jgi:5-deoxy-D-glucuronate isomerase